MSELARRWRRGLLAAAAALATVGATIAVALHANAALPPTPSGWSLVWSDDFTGAANTLPSAANWIIDTGTSYPGGPPNWGTGEIQTYTNSTANVRHDGNGNLVITPIRAANGSWTSARIETVRTDFKPAPGRVLRIEGRIQMPNVTGQAALGYWPAFWALGSPYRGNYQNWPAIGEFDIMENVNGLNSVWGVLHCGVAPGGPCDEFNGLGASRACPGSSCQSSFHTYRFEWDATNTSAQQLRWYVDGQQYHTLNQSQFGQNIGWIANGDWAMYPNVDFGSTPARTFRARVASGAPAGVSGLVQVRLGSPTAPVVAEFAIANTGGWQSWQTVPGAANNITGVHNVYLTFTSGQPAEFVNVNWFTFAT